MRVSRSHTIAASPAAAPFARTAGMFDCCMAFGIDQDAIEDAEELKAFQKELKACVCCAKAYAHPLRIPGGPVNPIDVKRYGWPEQVPESPFFGSDIISVPPETTRSSMPAMIALAAMLALVMPDPQNRSSVTPLAVMS